MTSNILLKVDNLSYSYPSFQLKNISISLYPGQITGFIGANGSGKTTTIRCITGQLIPNQGDSTINNSSIIHNPTDYKNQIGYVSEETDIFLKIQANTFINIAKRFYSNWDDNRFREMKKIFSLPMKKKLNKYSKGMKMKLHLAIALSHNADVLIMDEPTSGLDPFIRKEFLKILKKEATNNKSVLFSTHITEDILEIANQIVFIANGQIIFKANVNDIINGRIYRLKKNNYRQDDIVTLFSDDNYQYVSIKNTALQKTGHSLTFSDLLEYAKQKGGENYV